MHQEQEQIVTVPETETTTNDESILNAMPASKMMTRSMLKASRSSAASAETSKDSKTSKAVDSADFNPELEQQPAADIALVGETDEATKEADDMAAAETVIADVLTETATVEAIVSEG